MKCVICVSYMLWVIFVYKIVLRKTPKEEISWEAEVRLRNYIDIGLKGMRYKYETVLTGSIWMILISCSLCDVVMKVCLLDKF